MENKITTEKVPDFLIIGAQKSGTTSMHEYLKTHPEIYMSSPIKEPGLFLPFDHMQKYFSKFFNLNLNSREQLIQKCVLSEYHGERIFGESSTYYTITDMSRSFDIPKKIFEANPKMKLIYCIRNPLSRMVSHYLHCIKRGYTKSPLNKELSVKRDYLLTSLYYYQLEHYLKYFDKESFKIILFEALIKSPKKVFEEVFNFLGVDYPNCKIEFKVHHQSTNRNGFSKEDLKLSKENYLNVIGPIRQDVERMKEYAPDICEAWDLSEETWVKKSE